MGIKRLSPILDQFGNRYRSQVYDVERAGTDRGIPYWAEYGGDRDITETLPAWTWKRSLNFARWLHGNSGLVSGALREMANYALPLQPRYVGKDKRYKKAAEEWLWNWDKISDIRGGMYSTQFQSRIRLSARKIDGDIGIIFAKRENGMPVVGHIRAHRIGSGPDTDGEIKDGKYAGLTLTNGVIHDATGRPYFYRIYTGKMMDPTKYVDVSARNMRLLYDPIYSDQQRGLTSLLPSILDFAEVKQLREWEMFAQRKAAGMTFVEWNELGEPLGSTDDFIIDSEDGATTSGSASGLVQEVYEKGLKQYFKAGTGSRLEAVKWDRPGTGTREFTNEIITQAIYGMGWDPNFALAIKEPGGAWARTIIDKVRKHIEHDQAIEVWILRQIHIYATAVAIKRGDLEPPSDGDLISWEYKPPAKLTADSGNDAKAKQDAYLLGLTTRDSITSERGDWGGEVIEEREREVSDLFSRAERLAKRYDISMDKALYYLERRQPNFTESSNGSNGTNENQDDIQQIQQ